MRYTPATLIEINQSFRNWLGQPVPHGPAMAMGWMTAKIAVHVAPMCFRESSAPASLHLPLCLLTKLCSQLEQLGSFRNWLGQPAHGSLIRNLG